MNLLERIRTGHESAPSRLRLALNSLGGSLLRVAKAERVPFEALRSAVLSSDELTQAWVQLMPRQRSGLHSPGTVQVAAYVPVEQKQALIRLAQGLGDVSVSDLVRQFIAEGLATYPDPHKKLSSS